MRQVGRRSKVVRGCVCARIISTDAISLGAKLQMTSSISKRVQQLELPFLVLYPGRKTSIHEIKFAPESLSRKISSLNPMQVEAIDDIKPPASCEVNLPESQPSINSSSTSFSSSPRSPRASRLVGALASKYGFSASAVTRVPWRGCLPP